jgi:hypothetical protein
MTRLQYPYSDKKRLAAMRVKLLKDASGIALDSETPDEARLLSEFAKEGFIVHSFGTLLDGSARILVTPCPSESSDDLFVKALEEITAMFALIRDQGNQYLSFSLVALGEYLEKAKGIERMRRVK